MIAKMAWINRQEQDNSICFELGDYEDLHAVGEDYLEAVLLLNRQKGNVRSVDLADFLGRSKPTITNMVTRLCEGGFLIRDKHKYIHLSEKGREIAAMIYERHRFFAERLIEAGVDPKTAEKDACRLEHAISSESFQKLKDYLNLGKELLESSEIYK